MTCIDKVQVPTHTHDDHYDDHHFCQALQSTMADSHGPNLRDCSLLFQHEKRRANVFKLSKHHHAIDTYCCGTVLA